MVVYYTSSNIFVFKFKLTATQKLIDRKWRIVGGAPGALISPVCALVLITEFSNNGKKKHAIPVTHRIKIYVQYIYTLL